MYKPEIGGFQECKEKLLQLGFPYIKHYENSKIVVFQIAEVQGFQTFVVNLGPYVSMVLKIDGMFTDLVEKKDTDEELDLNLKKVLLENAQIGKINFSPVF